MLNKTLKKYLIKSAVLSIQQTQALPILRDTPSLPIPQVPNKALQAEVANNLFNSLDPVYRWGPLGALWGRMRALK